jgi:hypothetical protein
LVAAIDPDIYRDVDAALGLHEPGDQTDLDDELRKIGAKGVVELLRFCFNGPLPRRGAMNLAITKFLAIAQMMSPGALKGRAKRVGFMPLAPPFQLSPKQVAELVGCTTRDLRRFQRQFAAQWGWKLYVRPIKTSP